MDQKKFGEFVRKLREEKGLNQGELADILHVHRTAVNKWEKGNALPLNDTLLLMSDYFNVTIDELLSGERATKKNKNDNVILSLLKTRRKNLKIIKYITILSLILLITFLTYYFFTTYNSIHVYTLYGEGENYNIRDTLLIVSNEKVYLRIGNITETKGLSNLDVNNISLYIDDNGNKKTLFTGDPNELLTEKRDNIELFNTTKLKDTYDDIYIIISYEDNDETIKLNVKKDFQNKGLLFFTRNTTNENKTLNKEYYRINKEFIYNEEDKTYTLEKDNLKIVYSDEDNVCSVIEKKNNKRLEYKLMLSDNIFTYRKFIKEKCIFSENIYIDNMTDEESRIFTEFKEKYFDKYFSET